jgi:hypothetical protein
VNGDADITLIDERLAGEIAKLFDELSVRVLFCNPRNTVFVIAVNGLVGTEKFGVTVFDPLYNAVPLRIRKLEIVPPGKG